MTIMERSETTKKSQTLPPPGEHVVVHCPGFSCLGYLDKDGIWKNVFTDEPLSDVIEFSPVG